MDLRCWSRQVSQVPDSVSTARYLPRHAVPAVQSTGGQTAKHICWRKARQVTFDELVRPRREIFAAHASGVCPMGDYGETMWLHQRPWRQEHGRMYCG